ncbi:signal recognition particle, SRP19 subunit [Sphaerosporella brunnea]|uniref:Signal recognition particle, SRP19 subunit n=1 Tax=Sphaerosporella brunnea TaxID=1250544 RepID=A0A5J5F2U7_9PEZI|nr:signal recognition particle, SRP19 subunit [Sphaerosporella brunnea]
MSRQARIEEIEDSDPEEFDISALDAPELPIGSSVFQPGRHIVPPAPSSSTPRFSSSSAPTPDLFPDLPVEDHQPTKYLSPNQAQQFKSFQCLYPVYFDATRSYAQGRKVAKEFAVENPLAREIADACGALGLQAVFEPGKTHPKDWGNPGRVKVLLKKEGVAVNPALKNKFLLFRAVGTFLKKNPTTPETPLKLRIPNFPFDGNPAKEPMVPRGWKLGKILPLHSPAIPGPGVSDDVFKDMMEGMGMGGVMGGPAGPSAGGAAGQQVEKKEKKDKKKKR